MAKEVAKKMDALAVASDCERRLTADAGPGLGLAIALENTRAQGGSVSVTNVDGGGS